MMKHVLKPLLDRIQYMLGRAVVSLITDSSHIQKLQITLMADEIWNNVERFQDYGFTSHPHPGAEAVSLFLGGQREHGLVIKVDDRRYRLTGLQQGEVALYDDLGQAVQLTRTGIVAIANDITVQELTPGGTTATINANKVVVNSSDIHLGGEGGPRVARTGDMVQVAFGSSAGLHPIVDGSSKVRAAS